MIVCMDMGAFSLNAVVLFLCSGFTAQHVIAVESNSTLASNTSYQDCPVLYLLNVMPSSDDRVIAGWDRGLDLIPAGHLAAEQINNRSDILPGRELKIIHVDSEACDSRFLNKGLLNFYRELLSENNKCVIGVIGLSCSATTNVIARIAGHSKMGYVQMAQSVSPQLRNISEFPFLFHTISSSSAYNKGAIAIMKAFDWHRVGLIHDSLGFYLLSTSNDFVRQIKESYPSAEIVTREQLTNSEKVIPEVFRLINDQEIRISYWVISQDQGAFSLCEAYKRKFLWPGHVYITRFIDLNILHASEKTSCTRGEIELALEGVFLLEYRLFVNNDTRLYSGWTYSEFRQRYRERLYAEKRSDRAQESVYANTFYDQVWAFALAINGSLTSQNLSFRNYRIGNTKSIAEMLKIEFKKLSFQGASGRIEINELQEIPSYIDIFQVQNKTPILIGIYDPFTQNITFTDHVPGYVPGDMFKTIYDLLPSWLGGCMLTAQTILFCVISVNKILLLYWRKEKEIKASSPILSLLIIVGCYLLCVASVIVTVLRMIEIKNKALLLLLCNMNTWFKSIGLDMILATLLLRLLRVYRIFKKLTSIEKYWFDEYVFFYVLLICAGKVSLHVIWTSVDLIHPKTRQKYIHSAKPPYYKASLYCTSSSFGLWLLLSFLYSGMLLVLVLFLAFQTRHVKRDDFKDTKKVNLFLFLAVVVLTTSIPLNLIFSTVHVDIGADISEWLGYFAVALLCQLCLFVPKTVPLALQKFNIYAGNVETTVTPKSVS